MEPVGRLSERVQNAEIQGMSIVLLGGFNPTIFQPAWFSNEALIRKQEAEAARIEIIHPDIIVFSLEWLRLGVTRERFSVSTAQAMYYEVLRDLVLGTFKLLRHTPVRAMGINTDLHIRMRSEDEWHSFGHQLAPKALWADLLEKPGLRTLTMEGQRLDGRIGHIRVKVEPSAKVQPGTFFEVNDHYSAKDPNPALGCEEMMGILQRSWQESAARSLGIVSSLLERQSA